MPAIWSFDHFDYCNVLILMFSSTGTYQISHSWALEIDADSVKNDIW